MGKDRRETRAPPGDERADVFARRFAALSLPRPTLHFRSRAWLAFQRAIDPLGPAKPLPRRRSSGG